MSGVGLTGRPGQTYNRPPGYNKIFYFFLFISNDIGYTTSSGPKGPRRTEVKEDQMKNVDIEALKEQFTETREYGSDVLFAVRSIMLDVVMNSKHEPAEDFNVFTIWDVLNDIAELETCAQIYSKVAEDNEVPVVPVGYIEITEEGGFYFVPEDCMRPWRVDSYTKGWTLLLTVDVDKYANLTISLF